MKGPASVCNTTRPPFLRIFATLTAMVLLEWSCLVSTAANMQSIYTLCTSQRPEYPTLESSH